MSPIVAITTEWFITIFIISINASFFEYLPDENTDIERQEIPRMITVDQNTRRKNRDLIFQSGGHSLHSKELILICPLVQEPHMNPV